MKQLMLVQLNDLHGYLESHSEWFLSGQGLAYRRAGGMARIKSLLDGFREEYGDILFADNGDTFHGTSAVVQSQGNILPKILNRLGLSAMTGHWDFAYGPEALQQLVAELNYPFLAANVYFQQSGDLVFPPYLVKQVGRVRVGVIGLASNIVDKAMPPEFSRGIRFTDGLAELPLLITRLRQQERVEVVVLLSHLGLPQDLEMLHRVPGVDVCLSGHTHNRLEAPILVGQTSVMQSGCHGSFLGMLRIGVENGTTQVLEHRLVTVDESVPEDPHISKLVQEALAPYREHLRQHLGATSIPLNRATMLESSADTLLLDAIVHATNADVAFANGWRYGVPIPAGPITVEAISNLAPMDPEISLVELSGAEILQMMEENLERTFSREPFGQMGGYVKRCAGMRTYFKVENPNGTRVQKIFIGTQELDREKVYRAAYITSQAVSAKFGSNHRSTGMRLLHAVATYLRRGEISELSTGSFVEM